MRSKGFTLIELLILVCVVAIIGTIVWSSMHIATKNAELHDRFMGFCVKDMQAAHPYMDRAEIEERCEVQWDMKKMMEPKSDTTIIMTP